MYCGSSTPPSFFYPVRHFEASCGIVGQNEVQGRGKETIPNDLSKRKWRRNILLSNLSDFYGQLAAFLPLNWHQKCSKLEGFNYQIIIVG